MKNHVPATFVREYGPTWSPSCGLMFLTRTVPALVPSDFQSSRPWEPSVALKNSVPPTLVSQQGSLRRVCESLHRDMEATAPRAAFLSVSPLSVLIATAAVEAPIPASVTAAA